MSEIKAGRPKEENPRDVKVTVRFTKEENEKIEQLAKEMGMTKARMLRNLALGGLDDALFLNKIYVLPIAKKIFEWSDKVRGIDKNDRLD